MSQAGDSLLYSYYQPSFRPNGVSDGYEMETIAMHEGFLGHLTSYESQYDDSSRSNPYQHAFINAQEGVGHVYSPVGNDPSNEVFLTNTGRNIDSKTSKASSPSKLGVGRRMRTKFHGWRWGVFWGIVLSGLVLLVNILLVIIGATRDFGYQDGIATLTTGDGSYTQKFATASHIVINILATALLSASNYTMQVLSAPTRTACIHAHSKRQWVEIGIPNVRNLRYLKRRRQVLWLVLFCSSIPLHLFWNASIFDVKTDRSYPITVHEHWYGPRVVKPYVGWDPLFPSPSLDPTIFESVTSNGPLQRLLNKKYVSEYQQVRLFGSLAAVKVNSRMFHLDSPVIRTYVADANFPMDLETSGIGGPWAATIGDRGHISAVYFEPDSSKKEDNLYFKRPLANETDDAEQVVLQFWITGGIITKQKGNSRVQLSLPFMLVVIVCNILKLGAMVITLFNTEEPPIITIGDAISAFMTEKDPHTRRYCAYSKDEAAWKLVGYYRLSRYTNDYTDHFTRRKGIWTGEKRRYIQAVTRPIKYLTIILCFANPAIVLTVFLVRRGGIIPSAWGTQSEDILPFLSRRFDGPATAWLALFANSPQLLMSVIYMTFNALFTCMALAQEWNSLAEEHKGLRVSDPTGEQRETYFLQLPYRYSLPLNAYSGVMHWLMSQTLFLVRADRRAVDNTLQEEKSLAACGFSGMAFFCLLIALLTMDVIALITGRISFKSKIPFAGSCSWAISAACHSLSVSEDPTKKVKWGGVPGILEGHTGVGHYCFSNGEVTQPEVGKEYR